MKICSGDYYLGLGSSKENGFVMEIWSCFSKIEEIYLEKKNLLGLFFF